jgi:hypothetical protein
VLVVMLLVVVARLRLGAAERGGCVLVVMLSQSRMGDVQLVLPWLRIC